MNSFLTRLPIFVMIGIAALVAIILLVVIGILPGGKPPKPPDVALEFWGSQDAEEAWQKIIADYRQLHPNIQVTYHRFKDETYEETLVNRLAEGRGPDIFMLKNTWVRKHQDKIVPFPQQTFKVTPVDFARAFIDIATDDLISPKGEIFGFPLSIDTPILLYNKDTFNAASIALPPRTWDEVMRIAGQFTKKSPVGDIIKSGFAFGASRNVPYTLEILSSMIFQNGDIILHPETGDIRLSQGATNAMGLYTSFTDPTKSYFSWSSRLENSLDALANGNAVMTIGFPQDIQKVRAKNPHLNLGIAEFPQPKEMEKHILFGSYYFPTVAAASFRPNEAWEFLLFAASAEKVPSYLAATKRAPARRNLLVEGAPTQELDPLWRQALIARSWPIPDEAPTRKIFSDAVESVVGKAAIPSEAMQRLGERIGLLVRNRR